MNRIRSRNLAAGLLLAALALGAMTGCYTHITSASGPGADRYRVHKRNTDEIVLGKWFGEGPSAQQPAIPED